MSASILESLCKAHVLGLACAVFAGCAAPNYAPRPGESMVPIKAAGGAGYPFMCKDGQRYNVGYVGSVPAGSRIDLGTTIVMTVGSWQYTCVAVASFIPQVGQSYVLNSGSHERGRCFIEIVREDPSRSTGVAFEPTVTRGSSCPEPSIWSKPAPAQAN